MVKNFCRSQAKEYQASKVILREKGRKGLKELACVDRTAVLISLVVSAGNYKNNPNQVYSESLLGPVSGVCYQGSGVRIALYFPLSLGKQ